MAELDNIETPESELDAAPREAESGRPVLPVEEVRAAIAADDSERLRALVGDLHEADLGDLIHELTAEERPKLIGLLGPDFDFAALTELDDTVRLEILEELPTETIVEGLRELDSDDAVYILEDLEDHERAEILQHLPLPDQVALKRGLDFPEDSAGRLMQTDFVALPPFWTVGHTIDYLRETREVPDTFYEIYVIDPAFKLIGAVPLHALLRARRQEQLSAILNDDPRRVRATQDQEEVARIFERYNLVSAAVLDESERLVGVLTVDDILDVIQEEADEDLRAMGGVFGDEELSDNVLYTARSRFVWLIVNLATAFLAASVIGLFEGTISHMVALAVLMPICASMGGNAGTQTMTVTVRALATGDLQRRNVVRIILREGLVGFVNGVVLATVLGTIAGLWFENAQLGAVIGTALVVNMIVAGLFGSLIPLTIHKLKLDPAVASGVFLTTVTDVTGFFAFLGLATWWFGIS